MRNSEVLKQAWKRQPSWGGVGKDADKDVQIRQLLNAQLSMDLAKAGGLVWLLHLDSDELFLPAPPSCTRGDTVGDTLGGTHACEAGAATAHFAALATSGCECFVYHNLEGVPERLPEGAEAPPASPTPPEGGPRSDPFTQIDLFKVTESLIPSPAEPARHATLEAWRARTKAHKFFLYYESGKCACRVDTDGLWVPVSVHTCLPRQANGAWDEPRLHTRAWTNEGRNSGLRHLPYEASAVLHYPVWDPAALWHKYALHGAFKDELESGKVTNGGLVYAPHAARRAPQAVPVVHARRRVPTLGAERGVDSCASLAACPSSRAPPVFTAGEIAFTPSAATTLSPTAPMPTAVTQRCLPSSAP